MTAYSTWIAARRATVFPTGEAENLVANHNRYIQDALIDLQTKVRCLQTQHSDQYAADATLFDCGASVIPAPQGFIKSIHTILNTDCCSRVYYSPVSDAEMRCQMEIQERCGYRYLAYGSYLYDGAYVPYDYQYECSIPPDNGLDKPCRAGHGIVAMIGNQLYLYPHIQSNEIVVVEWDGIKRSWEDADDVEFDRTVDNAVELYLERTASRKEDFDPQTTLGAEGDYSTAVAMLIYRCEKEKRLPPKKYCFVHSTAGGCGC